MDGLTIGGMVVLGLFLTVILVSAVGLVRNSLVFDVRTKALSIIHDMNVKDINAAEEEGEINAEILYARYDILDRDSYPKMMIQLHKWKFEDFYPELVGEQNGI